ncbi:MAG: hypothetical protein AAB425_06880 [Bdellovibrionota bacterium]
MKTGILILTLVVVSGTSWASSRRDECLQALRGRVLVPVSGMYEAIPVVMGSVDTKELSFEVEDLGRGIARGERIIKVQAFRKNGSRLGRVGEFERSVSRNANGKFRLRLSNAKLNPEAPRFVQHPGTPELVPGRGMPTQLFATFLALKSAGVPYGGLEAASSRIHNRLALLEIFAVLGDQHSRSSAARNFAAVFPDTHAGRYFETIFTQSGHEVGEVEVHSIEWSRFENLVHTVRSSPETFTSHERAAMEEAVLRNCRPNGDCRDVFYPSSFDVEITLKPLPRNDSVEHTVKLVSPDRTNSNPLEVWSDPFWENVEVTAP